jgi:hypothetical protein
MQYEHGPTTLLSNIHAVKHKNDSDRKQWLGSDTKMTPTEANGLGQTQKGTILTNKQLQIYIYIKLLKIMDF